ncbi:MAG: putative GTPase, partial [Verrucomicrobiales bacterium]|nr:putative GTPase [Verrucomicrobiales bacterium]
AEKPELAGYVGMEMEILEWIGKPVVLLLNQTGPPRAAIEEELEEAEWRYHLKRFPVVRTVIGLDAFARCWVQEGELMDLIQPLLAEEKQAVFSKLRRAWEARHLEVFERSMAALGGTLAENGMDQVVVSKESFLQKLGVGRRELNEEMEQARDVLSTRLAERSVVAMDALISLHGLEGRSAQQINPAGGEAFGVPRKINESLWTAVGGALTGAAGGIVAEIKTGGLLLGGGALTGILLGGAGSYLLAKGFNLTRGEDHGVRWTEEHYAAQLEIALLCYLAVAHYGRGRGEWQDSEPPALWRTAVREVTGSHRRALDHLWKEAGKKGTPPEKVRAEAVRILSVCAQELLRRLYPRVGLGWLKG